MQFQHSAAIWRDFPALVPGVLYAEGITGHAEDRAGKFAAIATTRLAAGPEAELPEVQAWRRAFTRMGLKPTNWPSPSRLPSSTPGRSPGRWRCGTRSATRTT